MNQLPIQTILPKLRSSLATHKHIIIEAPTGSGKSTALPLALLDWPEIKGKILMLEPRRVAARSIAQYLSACLGQPLGQKVGFRIKGEAKVSGNTRLEVVTEGILTRMIQNDPELTGIDMVIFDEIHERHLSTDLGLALALEVQQQLREELTLVAMSATLSGLPLSGVMPGALSLSCEGRSFEIKMDYSAPKLRQDWLEHMGSSIIDLLNNPPHLSSAINGGSVLAFLPGRGEIIRLQSYLNARVNQSNIHVCPLYGALSAAEQDLAIAPSMDGRRKIVLATNVAESSLTIADVTVVVDSGFRREARFNHRTGTNKLQLKHISQSSSKQRSGRAGRLQPGYCLRLWSQEEQGRLQVSDDPQIMQTDLLAMVHDAAYWGVTSLDELNLLSPASKVNEQLAWSLLLSLEMITPEHQLTAHGRSAYELGCHPRLAQMLLKAAKWAQLEQRPEFAGLACLLAGLLNASNKKDLGSDIFDYLHYAASASLSVEAKKWLRALKIRVDLKKVASEASPVDIALLLAWAFPDRIAKSRGGSGSGNSQQEAGYQLANGTGVTLSPHSPLARENWLVVADFQEMAGKSAARVYLAAAFDAQLLDNELKYLITERVHSGWDQTRGKFYAQKRLSLGKVELKRSAIAHLDPELIAQALLEQIRQQGLALIGIDDKFSQLQQRVLLAKSLDQEYEWPDFTHEALLQTLEKWLLPYIDGVNSLGQLAKVNAYSLLKNCLSWPQQQRLAQMLPESWLLATGTQAKIHYQFQSVSDSEAKDEGRRQNYAQAVMNLRLQEALGMADNPKVSNGKLTVTMELLSPARRPLALTADLASFWRGPYQDVRKEMRGRYPKHLWPEDPVNTQATRFTKSATAQRSPQDKAVIKRNKHD